MPFDAAVTLPGTCPMTVFPYVINTETFVTVYFVFTNDQNSSKCH